MKQTSRRSILKSAAAIALVAVPTVPACASTGDDRLLFKAVADLRRTLDEQSTVLAAIDATYREYVRLCPPLPDVLFRREEDASFGLCMPGAIDYGAPRYCSRDLSEISMIAGEFTDVKGEVRSDGAICITPVRVRRPTGWLERKTELLEAIQEFEAGCDAARARAGYRGDEEDETISRTYVAVADRLSALAAVRPLTAPGLVEKAKCALSVLDAGDDAQDLGEAEAELWQSVLEDVVRLLSSTQA